MKWVTTNIRFPEDMYMDLKMEAAKRRMSLAALVRERIKEDFDEKKQKTSFKFVKHLKDVSSASPA